jgi:ABC-type dipeptide/oligopeptide/nickel transport system permease subunit
VSTTDAGSATGAAAAPLPGAGVSGGVVARSPWQLAWSRLRRDWVAIASFIFICWLVLFAAAAPLFESWTGHAKNANNPYGSDDTTLLPVTTFFHCYQNGHLRIGANDCFVLGASNVRGNDMLVQLAYGARTSLFIGLVSTTLTLIAALLVGLVAGFFGGVTDTVLSRFMDLIAAFPFLLFAIAMSVTIGASTSTVIFTIAFFSWFYPGRIFRGEVLSLREREFVAAARMLGATNTRILRKHILPHIIGPAIVYGTLAIASAIGFEAALSYLGFGVPVDVPSWGRMISDAVPGGLYRNDPWLMVYPGTLLVLTVLAFNLLGDGVRDALDPRGGGAA